MTTLPAELAALMPEPSFRLRYHSVRARYTVSKPHIGDTDVFTADQVRKAMLDATERAAKKVENFPRWLGENRREIAAAIRGDGGQG